MPKSFRQCADHYLQQWCELDREFWAKFSSGPISCESLAKLCWKYQVARTVPGHGIQKYKQFVSTLERCRGTQMTQKDVSGFIERQHRALEHKYRKSFLSAVTKAFWMMKRHPVVIYDSNARRGLQRCGLASGDGNYVEYCKSWFQFFDNPRTQRELDTALKTLGDSPRAHALIEQGKLSEAELQELSRSEWFRNRVTDMYLFYVGKPAHR